MSKYIDAEWIRNVYADFKHYDNRNDWTTPIANVLAVIDDAPSIDIVRCEECKYWRNTDAEKIPTASIACGNMHADDFCSYGEREDE